MLLESGPDAPLVIANVIHAKSSVVPLNHAESSTMFTFHADSVILEASNKVQLLWGTG